MVLAVEFGVGVPNIPPKAELVEEGVGEEGKVKMDSGGLLRGVESSKEEGVEEGVGEDVR